MKSPINAELERLQEILKASGNNFTRPRQLVVQALMSRGKCSIADLANELEGQVDRSSVYRCLDLFEGLGVVQRIQIGWKTQFELSHDFTEHHHHLLCIKCQQLIDLPAVDSVEQTIGSLAKEHDYELLSHSLELRGLCPDCRH